MIFNKLQIYICKTLVLSGLLVLVACSSSNNKDEHNFQYKSQLESFGSCDELSTYLLETAQQQTELYKYFDNEVVALSTFPAAVTDIQNDNVTAGSEAAPTAAVSTDSIVDYTTTNNQVSGVDEADFVKTDGDYTYIVTGGYFVIIDNWPAAQSKELVRLKLAGSTADLFVYQNIVWIVSHVTDYDSFTSISQPGFAPRVTQSTQVNIYDITDRSQPKLLRETIIEGYYVDARRIDNRVHMVTSAYFDLYPLLELQEKTTIDDLLPMFTDTLIINNESVSLTDQISPCKNIYHPGTANGTATLSLLSFDLDEPLSEMKRNTIISNSGTVYANEEHLYIATTEDNYWAWLPVIEGDSTPVPGTTFHKFDLTGDLTGEPVYLASGRVDGYLINQFAMDEHSYTDPDNPGLKHDLLRAVTTVDAWWSDGVPENSLFILEQSGNHLIQRSELKGLGKQGERIYAARFIGEKGFLVTFRQIDPLYTLDLSDPDLPRVAGELEVPGFSTYLHPLGDDLLLALGRNITNDSIDLSLFDISDFDNPSLLFRESVGDGSYTDAQYNHKAFTWFAQQKLLALPVTRWQGDAINDGFYNYDVFNGLLLYKVDEQTGFEFLGEIDHSDLYKNESELRWYYPDNIRRSFFTIDESQNSYLYSISSRGFKVNALPDLDSLVTLPLPVYEWQDNVLYW